MIKPRVGQVWAFGSSDGRRCKIISIKRGHCGRWEFKSGKLVPLGKSSCMWVRLDGNPARFSVKHLLQNWNYVSDGQEKISMTASGT